MNNLTYKEAYDKIIQAYFKDEIEPYNVRFCFCGTLCDNSHDWQAPDYGGIYSNDTHNNYMHYTGYQYAAMERALLLPLVRVQHFMPEYEDALFYGMCAALEVLKQIHIERGENVEGQFEFKKRELIPA